MANEDKKPRYLEDIARYQYADVAARLASSEETAPFVPGALEKLVDSFGVDKDILEGLKAGTFASQEGIDAAMKIYSNKYQQALGNLDVTEFLEKRYGIVKSILGDEGAEKAKEVFEKYKGKTIASIRKKFGEAQYVLKDEYGLFPEEKKVEAKKTREKLAAINNLIGLLEQRNYEELRNSATKSTYKKMFEEALKKA